MEGFLVTFAARLISLFSVLFLMSCSSSLLKYEKADQLKKNEEFESAVQIVKPTEAPEETAADGQTTPAPETTPVPAPTPAPAIPAKTSTSTKSVKKESAKKTETVAKTTPVKAPAKEAKKSPSKDKKAVEAKASEATRRQPELEDDAGFDGRRPLKDPFRVGEEVVHDVHYFKVSAGELKMKVEPFSMVNNRKSYTFAIEIKTSSLFSSFYSVEDRVETFVDFETLVPSVFQLHVKESGQLREAKMLFDNEKNTATFWEKKVTKENGEEEKKQQWDILPFTQNVYSAIYYMRNFQWETGKEYSFRVGNDNENLVFSGKAIRREVLDTNLGPMKAIVIKPNIVLKGKLKPIGDNYIWLSDDDRKYVLRIEAKIKIGTLVSEVVSIKPGK
ncbi:DUF3108 domain-containing protein [Bdellovibrio sp. 22V]|uniref:DUF3108 domain-containing protein n=1 Tax=Bdellovibrio TaxID=958 RepID=UPI002543B77F|nr:DUF3108 domain-containing protein [Bdellovibrio sp. 22V]WII72018.1 DUF3108 domain-containing protein [Bdellovibrio sp. 22V]